MSDREETQYQPTSVSPPGETLAEILEDRCISQADLARRTGRPRKTINEIIKGKAAITAETALQFERALGVSADFWNRRESRYRQYLAQTAEAKRLGRYISWLNHFNAPVFTYLRKRGYISKTRDKKQRVADLLSFFGVNSPQEWTAIYANLDVAYRRSMPEHSNVGAVSAWIRIGELLAQDVECNSFDAKQFRSTLSQIRTLTREDPEVFHPKVIEHCQRAGVVVVLVPFISGARVSGITRWLTANRALIQLSLYGKTDDLFWFSFFHEAGHILNHGKRRIFIESSDSFGSGLDEEDEANRFARDILIPPRYKKTLRSLLDRRSILRFAEKIGVAPGIIVGRLQHDGILNYATALNRLKVKYEIAESD